MEYIFLPDKHPECNHVEAVSLRKRIGNFNQPFKERMILHIGEGPLYNGFLPLLPTSFDSLPLWIHVEGGSNLQVVFLNCS